MTDLSAAQQDGLAMPHRAWAGLAMWLALLLAVLDSTLVNVALPTIANDLASTPAQSVWVVNAYQIAIVMTLLPLAALSEVVGQKTLYLVGLTAFIAASLVCAAADTLPLLAGARFAQGLAASSLMSVNGALVRAIYPRAILGRGVGYNALVVAVAAAAGPSVAGAILTFASWRWLFAINIPLGLVALAVSLRALPRGFVHSRRYDWLHAGLVALAFAMLFLGSSELIDGTGGALLASLGILLALAIFAWLARTGWSHGAPLLPVDLLRIRALRLSYVSSVCAFTAHAAAAVALPFAFQWRLELSPAQVGLLLTPWPIATAVAAPLAGRLVERIPAGVLGCVGLLTLAAGLLVLAVVPPDWPTAVTVLAMVLCGAGFGLFQSPNNRTMIGGAPLHRSGAAAGMLATMRLTGQTCGALAVALVFHVLSAHSVAPLVLGAMLATVGGIVSLLRETRP